MELYSETNLVREKGSIDLTTIALVCIVGLSFLLHLFTTVFSGYAYALLVFGFTILFIFSKEAAYKVGRNNKLLFVWMLAVAVMAVSFFRSQRSNGALLDVIVFACGFLLLLFCTEREEVYARCFTVIKVLAVFFAAGIWIQRFLAPVYRAVLAVFPTGYGAALRAGEPTGFTLNSGYSAGYIIAGILVVLSQYYRYSRFRKRDIVLCLFLFAALIMTGKRGPLVFLIVAAVCCLLAPLKRENKARRYLCILLLVVVAGFVFWALKDELSAIPAFEKIYGAAEGLAGGEDISTGRSKLYGWAIELFTRNPVMGIGWGRYRTTTIGNVTVAKELETHDIYLQLLAEDGIIGFAVFIVLFVIFWNTTRIAYPKCLRENEVQDAGWKHLLFFAFAYQTYFLLYGLTGNPLYDPHFQIMYIFSCMIPLAYRSQEKQDCRRLS